jgi:hypothetical protein
MLLAIIVISAAAVAALVVYFRSRKAPVAVTPVTIVQTTSPNKKFPIVK